MSGRQSIVDLYWARSENAIHETSIKYGKILLCDCFNILNDSKMPRKCSMIHIWGMEQYAAQSPGHSFYFPWENYTARFRLTGGMSKDAQKRGNGEIPLALEELSDAVTASDSISEKIAIQELSHQSINSYLLYQLRSAICLFVDIGF